MIALSVPEIRRVALPPELRLMPLEPLSEDDAAALLDHTAPDLPAPLRHRLLAAAHGNPLALTELPTAVAALDNLTTTLPVTERLEHAFTARSATLPGRTRTALLVAALNDSDSIDETLSATSVLLGTPAEVKILTPAVEARLLTLGPGNVAFRHPLMRSALIATATAEERARAHHSLADILTEYPDRRTWQRAAATASPDEQVARDLEDVAKRARHRSSAITALERAAELSDRPVRRADRLLRAAELAVDSGRRETAERLVLTARALPTTPRHEATAAWLLSGFDDGVREDPARIAELAALSAAVAADGHPDAAMRILWGAAMRCFWSEPGPDTRHTLLTIADALPIPADNPRLIAVYAWVAPFERGEQALDRLHTLAADPSHNPQLHRLLGSAAHQVGAYDLAAHFSAAAAPGLRATGQLGLLPRALTVQACSFYADLILSATCVAGVADGRVSRLPASPCGGVGLTVSHTDACDAGTYCFGVTPNR